jgi:hypothetical protein
MIFLNNAASQVKVYSFIMNIDFRKRVNKYYLPKSKFKIHTEYRFSEKEKINTYIVFVKFGSLL